MESAPSATMYYLIFFFTGIATMLLSLTAPHLTLPDAQVGTLLATQFTGQLLGALLVTRRAHACLAWGVALTAVAAILIGNMPTPHLVILLALGLGLGLTMTSTNIVVGTESAPAKRGPRMERLNFFWPLGAASAPWIQRFAGTRFIAENLTPLRIYLWIGIVFAGMAALFAHKAYRNHSQTLQQEQEEQPATPIHLLRLCIMGLLAVGTETAISNWGPTFAFRYIDTINSGAVASIFWCGIVGSRVIASIVLGRVGWSSFAIAMSLMCATGAAAMAVSTGKTALYAAALLAAICIAPVYPVVLANAVVLRGKTLVFFSAGVGSALLPWAVGNLSLHLQSLRWAMLTPVFAAVVLASLLWMEKESSA